MVSALNNILSLSWSLGQLGISVGVFSRLLLLYLTYFPTKKFIFYSTFGKLNKTFSITKSHCRNSGRENREKTRGGRTDLPYYLKLVLINHLLYCSLVPVGTRVGSFSQALLLCSTYPPTKSHFLYNTWEAEWKPFNEEDTLYKQWKGELRDKMTGYEWTSPPPPPPPLAKTRPDWA